MPGSSGRLLLLWQDINERKRMEETAARLERRQSTVFRQSGDCIIEINLRTWQFHRNASAPSLPSEPCSGDYRTFHAETIAMVHPPTANASTATTTPKASARGLPSASPAPSSINIGCSLAKTNSCGSKTACFFLEEGDDMTAFFIIRDITEQKRVEEERALEEERYNIALRNTYTEIYEIDLSADTPHLVYAADTPMIPVDHDKNGNIHTIAATLIHPEDGNASSPLSSGATSARNSAKAAWKSPPNTAALAATANGTGFPRFIVPLCGHDSCRTDKGILLVRDISEQREEEQRRRISEQYDHALRNIYDELYELNITQDSYRIVYHVKGKYVTPPEQGRLSECIDLVSRNMLFPEDRTRFLEFFNLDCAAAELRGGPGIPYRRIPQALARPGDTTGRRITHVPRGPARRRRRDLSRLHHGYRGQEAGGGKSLSRTSSLSASASTTNATGPSWSRRTPSSSSGTSKPIPVTSRR